MFCDYAESMQAAIIDVSLKPGERPRKVLVGFERDGSETRVLLSDRDGHMTTVLSYEGVDPLRERFGLLELGKWSLVAGGTTMARVRMAGGAAHGPLTNARAVLFLAAEHGAERAVSLALDISIQLERLAPRLGMLIEMGALSPRPLAA